MKYQFFLFHRSLLLLILLFYSQVQCRPYILFANKKDIRLFEVPSEGSDTAPKTTIVVKHLEDATAFDFFLEDGIVCWTEIAPKVIRCSEIDPRKKGRAVKNTIVNTGLLKPEGLACDWIGKKIYWTDSETKRIEVSNLVLNSAERKVLVWEDLDLPRAIVLSPLDGLMFWSDWGTYPKIERAGMDGSDRRLLVDQNLGWPNGITLDYENRLLYWIEAKWHYIASVDWEGRDQKNYYSDKNDLPQPFAISFKGNALYWTDWTTNSLHTMNTSTWYENAKTIDRIKLRGKLTPMDIKVFEPSRQQIPESPSPCATNNGGCSHLCLSSPQVYSCSCPTGLQMIDESNCAQEFENVLLMARRDDLRKISLDTPDLTDLVIPLQFGDGNSSTGGKHEMNSIAIDYDPVLGDVYWTDQFLGIHRAKLDGSNVTDVIIEEVDHPDGLAVDWLTRNVYWSDTGTDRIEVARLNNGSVRRVVVSGDLDEPRGIALDSINGWMYWSDWGKPAKIEKAWMDGRHRQILVSERIVWPNGVTIDIETQKLYWCDAKTDKIEVINVDGTGRRVIVSEILPHPFGLTVLNDYVYWTDWREKTLERAHKDSGEDREILISHLKGLMGLKASMTRPNVGWNNGCSVNNGGCSHLCLITPSGRVCTCPNDYEIFGDQCEKPDAYLLYTRKDNIGRVSVNNPEHNGFTLPLKDIRHASALDYDERNGVIYWTDVEDKTISQSFINGSSKNVIIEFGLDFPDGLAFDWISKNIYWTDMGSNRIDVYSSLTSKRKCLIWKNLHSPSSLVLDPANGEMYWSSWGSEPFIEKSALDGSSRSVFLNDMGRSFGLTIDFSSSLLYWSDLDGSAIAFVSIEEGSDKVVKRILSESIKQPYGLTLYKDTLYWSDWDKSTIEKANKKDGSNRVVLQKKMDEVMDILLVHDTNKGGSNPCAVSNGNCSDLCLFVHGKATCHCPSHYETRGGSNKCLPPNSFILYSQKNKASRLLMNDEHHVPDVTLPIKGIRNIKSIAYDPVERMLYWIDLGGNRRNKDEDRLITIRKAHDLNGTLVDKHWLNLKEKDFLPYDLSVDYVNRLLVWTCEKTNVINVTRLDESVDWTGGVILLPSNSEDKPRSIEVHSKKGLIFWTNFGSPMRIERCTIDGLNRKILVDTSLSYISDIEVDEADSLLFWVDVDTSRIESSDLEGNRRQVLINLAKSKSKHEPVFIAVDDVNLIWGVRESLRLFVADKRTGLHMRQLKTSVKHLSSLIYVSVLKRLESPCVDDCSHFCLPSGLCSCPPRLLLGSDGRSCGSPPTCQPDQFSCASGTPSCIPFQWRCDGQPECSDHSDEMDCPECGANQFRCMNGQCINGTLLCDKTNHCSDNSDELNCCPGNQFQCVLSKECIPRNLTCNALTDCSDRSDEMLPQCGSSDAAESSSPLDSELTKTAVPSNTSTYLIVIFVGLMSILVFGLSVYYCKRKSLAVENETAGASNPMLNAAPATLDQRNILGGDGPVLKKALPGSSNGLLYDRNQLTGASSSSSHLESGLPNGLYAGPHPSPATSVVSHSLLLRRPHIHRPPPPTPCSTDINEEDSEYYVQLPIRPHFPSAANSVYDSETYGPPKNSLLHGGESSPNTERSFFIDKSLLPPEGPPPSPVPSLDNINSLSSSHHIINP